MYTKENSPKVDLRVRRTRKLLWEALMELLIDHTFDSLTVNQICECAMVHRTTFYKHFEDKVHLLSYGMLEITSKYAEVSYEDRIRHPFRMFNKLGHQKQFHSLLHALDNNAALKAIIERQGADQLKNDLRELEKNGKPFSIPIDVIAYFYSGAIAGLGTWWLRNDNPVSAEQMDEYFSQMIHPEIFFPEDRVGGCPLVEQPTSHTTVRTVRYTAVQPLECT